MERCFKLTAINCCQTKMMNASAARSRIDKREPASGDEVGKFRTQTDYIYYKTLSRNFYNGGDARKLKTWFREEKVKKLH